METSIVFTKGLNIDLLPKFQEEGTYRFALNAVLETEDGDVPSISNEPGNTLCATNLPNKTIIGSASSVGNETILFLYDADGEHEIGIHNADNCTYTSVVVDSCLNFSDKHQINALVKIRQGCNRVVYFTDNYNPYRVIDIDDPQSFNYPQISDVLDCDRLRYSRTVHPPCISLYEGIDDSGIIDNSGGNLPIGVYYFAVRFLDAKLNPSRWTTVSRGAAIGDETFKHTLNSNTINLYDGGSNNIDSDYYVQPADKTIQLLITGESYAFDYFQVAVIKRTGDDGSISEVEILKPEPWGIGSVKYQYSGDPTKIERLGTLDEILVQNLTVDKVKSHAIKDQRLFLGNLSYSKRDYSSYQRYASKIKTEWEKTAITSTIDSGVRQADYYHLNGSFMEDEIYPFGIVFVHKDGDSPVFPIPGRAPNQVPATAFNPFIGAGGIPTVGGPNWDTGVQAYGSLNSDLPDQSRWRYISTALQYNSGTLTGLMGYHECETETYPVVPNCDDHPDGYWGRDWQNNLIVAGTTKIRHHRMPGAELRDNAANTDGFRVGVKFSNVEYPNTDVIGHYFVYGDRTFEKTIQTKGVLIPKRGNALGTTTLKPFNYTVPIIPGIGLDTRDYIFISASGLLKDQYVDGAYFKTEKVLRDTFFETVGESGITKNTSNSIQLSPNGETITSETETTYRFFSKYVTPVSGELINTINTNITAKKSYAGAFVGAETYNPTDGGFLVNNSINHNYQFLHTSNGPLTSIVNNSGNWMGKMYYGSIKVWKNVFSNLFGIRYKRMNNCISTGNINSIYVYYGGDTALNRVSFVEFDYTQTGIPPEESTFNTNAVYISFLAEDSSVNYEFRHGSTKKINDIYFQSPNSIDINKNHSAFVKYLEAKKYEIETGIYGIYPETYNYNNSFSFLDGIQNFYPVPFNYDFCNLCAENFPYRIYFSQKDNQETSEDLSRIVKVNDYQDLSGLSGEITDLFLNFNDLYATTVDSLFVLPINAQTIQTDVSNIYLGTADVLSIPAIEMKNTERGFGGQRFFKSRISTEYGTFYVDDTSKRPLLLNKSLQDLSTSGMMSYWLQHGRVFFEDQFFKLADVKYDNTSTSSSLGVGYISTYDPRYLRLIVHKRDFRLLSQYEDTFTFIPQVEDDPNSADIFDVGTVWYNGHNFYYIESVEPISHKRLQFEDAQFFEDLSFTLSYSFKTGKWVSFHSYLPNYLFNTSTDFLSQKVTGLHKHNQPVYQTYYDKKFPHIIDVIQKQSLLGGVKPSTILYTSKVSEFSSDKQTWKTLPITWDAFVAYNSHQTTGLQLLQEKKPFDNDISHFASLTQEVDNYWRINNIRDFTFSNNEAIWDYSWAAKNSMPYSFIDKVVNVSNINPTKSLFESARFRDHYIGTRFFFLPSQNYRISTNLISGTSQNKNR